MEVLQLVAEGKVNKQIAADLCISIKTVEKHRQQVMNKLNIHDVAGLTRYAISRGIIESTPQLAVVLLGSAGLFGFSLSAAAPASPEAGPCKRFGRRRRRVCAKGKGERASAAYGSGSVCFCRSCGSGFTPRHVGA